MAMNLGHLVVVNPLDASRVRHGPHVSVWTHVPFPRGSTIYKYYGRTKNQAESTCTQCCLAADAQDLYLTEYEALHLVQTGCLLLKREEKEQLIENIHDWSFFIVYSLLRSESYIPKRVVLDKRLNDNLAAERTTCFDVWLPNTRYKKSLLIPDFKLFLIDVHSSLAFGPVSNANANADTSSHTSPDSLVLSFLSSFLSDLNDPPWIICGVKDAFAEYSFISLTIKNNK